MSDAITVDKDHAFRIKKLAASLKKQHEAMHDIKIDDLREPASRDVVIHFDEQRDEVDVGGGWFSSASLKFSKSASSFSSHRANENKDEKRCYVCGTSTLCPLRVKDPDCPHIACSLKCLHRLSPQWIDIKSGLQELERDLAPKSALEER